MSGGDYGGGDNCFNHRTADENVNKDDGRADDGCSLVRETFLSRFSEVISTFAFYVPAETGD